MPPLSMIVMRRTIADPAATGSADIDGADTDPFGTVLLRRAVLDAWVANPGRFREDANAEERLSLGYGGRVLAELAANGADAAREAGELGSLAISLTGRELRIANTGAPLDAAGVASLASLRASAKRDRHTVGHFGVGFTAVRAISDEVTVVSRSGAIRFSAAATTTAVTQRGNEPLASELDRRDGRVPALRLPWPTPVVSPDGLGRAPGGENGVDPPPAGFDTEIRLLLRDEATVAAVTSQLSTATAEDLLWALPDLAAVTIAGCRVDRSDMPTVGVGSVTVRFSDEPGSGTQDEPVSNTQMGPPAREYRAETAVATGTVPAELLTGGSIEDRSRSRWWVAWILPGTPVADAERAENILGSPDRALVGAPTPTDEPLALPARLVGTFPVTESRDRIAMDPLTDFLIAEAAAAYGDLVLSLPAARRVDLVPEPGFPVGQFDAAIRAALTDQLARAEFLTDAADEPVAPQRAVLVPGLAGPAARCASEAMPGLLHDPAGPATVARLRSLGVRLATIDTLTAALAQLTRPPSFWRTVYDGLSDIPTDRLADLPVPLMGGGTVIGPHTVLLPTGTAADTTSEVEVRARADDLDTMTDPAGRAAAMVPGLRIAAMDHPLLRRVGARPADPHAILEDPGLMGEIRRRAEEFDSVEELEDIDATDLRAFADAVIGLVDASIDAGVTAVPALAELLLTDETDAPCPAGELLMPDAPLAHVLAGDAEFPTIASTWLSRYGEALLTRLGVRAGFGLREVALPPEPADDLPDLDEWWDEVSAEPGMAAAVTRPGPADEGGVSMTVVTDLDLIDPSRWPETLALLAADPECRAALRPIGGAASYTTWWLRRHTDIGQTDLARLTGTDPNRRTVTGKKPRYDEPAAASEGTIPRFDTPLTRLVDLTVPVVCAPMAGVADAGLAKAVSEAGGLGCVGIGSTRTLDWIAAQLDRLADAAVPFGIGLMAWSIPADPTAFEMVLDARPSLLSISLGDLDPWVARARDAGIVVAVQVGTRDEAVAAQRAGASIIVARGAEGGGHGRNAVATLPLLQSVLDAVDVPVLAGGGVSGPRGLAAALAAGAAGAWVGTAFAGCREATSAPDARRAMDRAAATDTVYGRVFDVAQRLPWPAEFGGRALTNDLTDAWWGREEELARRLDGEDPSAGITAEVAAARADGDARLAPVYCGQGVGEIRVEVSAADIVADFAAAGDLLRRAAATLGGYSDS